MTENEIKEQTIKNAFDFMGKFLTGPQPRKSIGYGQGQMRIIYFLSIHESSHPNELADFLQVGTGRIGNVLKDLEKRKIIKRTSDPNDKRKTTVRLTDSGKKFASDRFNDFRSHMERLIDKMGIDQFNHYLDEFTAFFNVARSIKEEQDKPCSNYTKI
jgi:DNA-binding MarR family transcriptional regulator